MEVSDHHDLDALILGEELHYPCGMRGWVGHRAHLDFGEEMNFCVCCNWTPGSPAHVLVSALTLSLLWGGGTGEKKKASPPPMHKCSGY